MASKRNQEVNDDVLPAKKRKLHPETKEDAVKSGSEHEEWDDNQDNDWGDIDIEDQVELFSEADEEEEDNLSFPKNWQAIFIFKHWFRTTIKSKIDIDMTDLINIMLKFGYCKLPEQLVIAAGGSDSAEIIIKKHFLIAGQMRKLVNLRNYLIQQIHRKKSKEVKGKCYPIHDLTKKIYNKILFDGQDALGAFPTHCWGDFETTMFDELGIKNSDSYDRYLLCIYTNGPWENPYAEFDKDANSLSNETKCLTCNDIKIIKDFARKYLEFLGKWKALHMHIEGRGNFKEADKQFSRAQKHLSECNM
eukprot:3692_1